MVSRKSAREEEASRSKKSLFQFSVRRGSRFTLGYRGCVIRRGFTLIEIALSIAVVAMSLGALLAVFPLAMDTADKGKDETRVSLIAQSILADLRRSRDGRAQLFSGSDPSDPKHYLLLDLMKTFPGSSVCLAYDWEGRVLAQEGMLHEKDFKNGVKGAVYLARVEAVYDTKEFPGMARVSVWVETPGSGAEDQRKRYRFVTAISG